MGDRTIEFRVSAEWGAKTPDVVVVVVWSLSRVEEGGDLAKSGHTERG